MITIELYKELGPSTLSAVSVGSVSLLSIWGNELFSIKKVKILTGKATIPFWYFKKYSQEVDHFIAVLKRAKMEYYRKTYLKVESYEDVEEARQRLIWLRTQSFISDDELSEWLLLIEAKRLL